VRSKWSKPSSNGLLNRDSRVVIGTSPQSSERQLRSLVENARPQMGTVS
jgi:hypothetical protein